MGNILSLTILTSLTLFLYFYLNKIFQRNFITKKNSYENLKTEYEDLLQEGARIKKDGDDLEKTFRDTETLYDITSEICKYLDIDKVFASFKEQVNRYINISECKFFKNETDLPLDKNYIIIPLTVENKSIGFLLANGIKSEDKDKFHILTQQFLLGLKRAFLYQKVQESAIMDDLTQVFSRRHSLERLKEEIERSNKFKYHISFLMVDIDRFKECNDRYGHLVGDGILREVSKTIKENLRQIDFIGRYGGEEFLIILSETDKMQARVASERIRQAIENKHIRIYDEDLRVTVSIGVSSFPEDGKQVEELIENSDAALYQAKVTGRNRVCLYG